MTIFNESGLRVYATGKSVSGGRYQDGSQAPLNFQFAAEYMGVTKWVNAFIAGYSVDKITQDEINGIVNAFRASFKI